MNATVPKHKDLEDRCQFLSPCPFHPEQAHFATASGRSRRAEEWTNVFHNPL